MTEKVWRNLALQFDEHRMLALAHLRRALDTGLQNRKEIELFLQSPPRSGKEILADKSADTDTLRAEVTALTVIYAESKRNNDDLRDKIARLITDKNKDALEYCALMDKYDAAQVWTVQLREALEEVIFARHKGDEK